MSACTRAGAEKIGECLQSGQEALVGMGTAGGEPTSAIGVGAKSGYRGLVALCRSDMAGDENVPLAASGVHEVLPRVPDRFAFACVSVIFL